MHQKHFCLLKMIHFHKNKIYVDRKSLVYLLYTTYTVVSKQFGMLKKGVIKVNGLPVKLFVSTDDKQNQTV